VKKIIDAHKGTIAVVSEPGRGTSFTICLPLAQPEDKR
jgi:signal transduction histidine kinase